MDSVLFYVPHSVPASQPPRSSGARAAFLPAVPPFPPSTTASNSACQTAAQRSNQDETRKDFHIAKCIDMSVPALPGYLPKQRTCRDDLTQVQENSTAAQNVSHLNEDSEDDDFPTVEQVLSSRRQDSTPASARSSTANMSEEVNDAPNTMQQSHLTRVENTAEEANGRTRDNSSADSSHLTAGTTQDPIILSDNEPEGAESETDYSDLDFNLNFNLTAKNDSRSLHNLDGRLAGDDDFDSGTTFNSSHLAAECHKNNSNNGDGVIDTAKRLRSASRPQPASPCSSIATYPTSKLQLNTKGTKGGSDYIDNSVLGQLEGDTSDVFAEDDNGDTDDTPSTKRRKLTTISPRIPTSNSAIPKQHKNQHDRTQSPQPGLTAAGPQQIEFKSPPLRELRRRGVIRSDPYKRPTSPVKLATTATMASAALESTELDELPSGSPVAGPNQELEISNILGQKNTNDPNIEDYSCEIDVTGSNTGDLPRSLKWVRWAEDKDDPANTTPDDIEEDSPTSSVNVPSQAVAATLSGAEQESEEIAIHGHLTLKTHQLQVLYCLTFSQESLPRPLEKGQQQDVFMDQSEGIGLDAEPNQEWAVRNVIGQKMIDEEMHYHVVWEPTWVPESELAGARELVDVFLAKSQYQQGGIGAGRGKQAPRAAPGTSIQPDARGKVGPPKRRGRPPKQK